MHCVSFFSLQAELEKKKLFYILKLGFVRVQFRFFQDESVYEFYNFCFVPFLTRSLLLVSCGVA